MRYVALHEHTSTIPRRHGNGVSFGLINGSWDGYLQRFAFHFTSTARTHFLHLSVRAICGCDTLAFEQIDRWLFDELLLRSCTIDRLVEDGMGWDADMRG